MSIANKYVCRVVLFCDTGVQRLEWRKSQQKLLILNVLITFLNGIAYLTTGTNVTAGICKS